MWKWMARREELIDFSSKLSYGLAKENYKFLWKENEVWNKLILLKLEKYWIKMVIFLNWKIINGSGILDLFLLVAL